MTRTTSDHAAESTSWMARFADYMFEASMPRVVREVRTEASSTFREVITDLESPMPAAFEREIARTLNGVGSELIPAETLMPAMMKRFGLAEEAFVDDGDKAVRQLQVTCNHCPEVGRCWRAMRSDTSRESCRAFCPNADAFEEKAGTAA